MIRTVLVIFALLPSFLVSGQSEDTLLLKTRTGVINGSLMMPPGSESAPVVLIIAGSGPTDRDGNNTMMKNNHLKYLAEGLARYGIASLRYDKRGIGQSAEASPGEINMRIEIFADDAADWIDVLRQDDRFTSVSVLGHSIGSLIAILAAQQGPVDGLVSLAGAGLNASQTLRDQLSEQSEIVMQFAEPILERLENGELVDTIDPMLNSLFRPSVQPYLLSWMAYDPAEELAKVEVPVMITQGSNDIQVPVNHAIALSEARPDAKLFIVEGMNHVLKEAPPERLPNITTYFNPELPVVPELIRSIASFINGIELQDHDVNANPSE